MPWWESKRYEEAVPCFDKVLEMRPNSVAWYRKGLCCYHLERHEEAIACFDKTLAACADKDRQLFEEASRHRKLAEEALLSADPERETLKKRWQGKKANGAR